MSEPVRLFHGDNLEACSILHEEGTFVDFCYIDPPFGVGVKHGARANEGEERNKRTSVAYFDVWEGIDSFITALEVRLRSIHRILSKHGSLYLHLDHRTVHEAKVTCDRIFGRDAFRGEIIWLPGNGARSKKAWGASHQTILFYTRDDRKAPKDPHWIFNTSHEKLREPYASVSMARHFKASAGSEKRIRKRTIQLATGPKTYEYDADKGRRLGTVWTDIHSMSCNTPLSNETTGYPHQKPEELLERLILASTHEGMTVADFFCGSGTTLVVGARLNRKVIGCDAGILSVETSKNRLEKQGVSVVLQQIATRQSP